jgi:protein-tyrosine-phosphatase
MAESIALRDASDLMETASAGLSPLGTVQKLTLQTLEANGYSTDGLYSKPILKDTWAEADLVINMSGYPRERAFARSDWHKVEDWSVDDPYGSEPAVYQRTFEDIRTKVESLVARLRDRRPAKS